MLYIREISNHCEIEGDPQELEDVLAQVLVQQRDKEKKVLVLYKEDVQYNSTSTSSTHRCNSECTLKCTRRIITFPSGLLNFLIREIELRDIDVEVTRLPRLVILPIPINLLSTDEFPIELRDYQVTSIRKGVTHRRGIFNIATGGGKTEVIIGMAKIIGNSLTIVPSKSSLKQTYARFKKRGITDVGRLGGGFGVTTAKHTVATASVISSRLKSGNKAVKSLLNRVELLMFDEVHHLGTAASWQRVASACPAPRRFGFSGSPWATGMPCIDLGNESESSYADFKVVREVGESLVYIPSKMLREMGVIVDPSIYVVPVNEPKGLMRNPFPQWRSIYKSGIIENEHRNNLVIEAAARLTERKHRTAILVVSIPHGTELLKRLYAKNLTAAFTKGDDEVLVYTGKKIKKISEAGEKYRDAFLDGEIDVLIGSVVIDEAVDLPGMSALILAGGGKSPIRAVQRIGRAIRTSEGKNEAIVIDFRDRQHFFLNNHTNKRLGIYTAHAYDYEETEWDELWKRI